MHVCVACAGREDSWLTEAQCEVAWQMGKWQEGSAGQQQSSAEGGFNSAVCKCLQVTPSPYDDSLPRLASCKVSFWSCKVMGGCKMLRAELS